MDAVTFGAPRAPTVVERMRVVPRKSFFTRFLNALQETRRREARRVIEKYTHLMPPDES